MDTVWGAGTASWARPCARPAAESFLQGAGLLSLALASVVAGGVDARWVQAPRPRECGYCGLLADPRGSLAAWRGGWPCGCSGPPPLRLLRLLQACYLVRDAVHSLWGTVPGRCKDYIAGECCGCRSRCFSGVQRSVHLQEEAATTHFKLLTSKPPEQDCWAGRRQGAPPPSQSPIQPPFAPLLLLSACSPQGERLPEPPHHSASAGGDCDAQPRCRGWHGAGERRGGGLHASGGPDPHPRWGAQKGWGVVRSNGVGRVFLNWAGRWGCGDMAHVVGMHVGRVWPGTSGAARRPGCAAVRVWLTYSPWRSGEG